MVRHYRNQNYGTLRHRAQRTKQLFTDPEFPPTAESVFLSGRSDYEIVWKRPGEMCVNPKLMVNCLSNTYLNHGFLGNCWFVAACSSLAREKKNWERVVPNWRDQEWNSEHPENYAGIFHFRLWKQGEWVDVVVDDFLPTFDGKLAYMRSLDDREFWSALLEKAYAKLAGSYEALVGGQPGDALEDFTGGVSEPIDLKAGGYCRDEDKRSNLLKKMQLALEHRALISCYIALSEGDSPGTVLDCGLIKGHAYCVIDIIKLSMDSGLSGLFSQGSIAMVRVRSPWGEKEWKGPWSEGSEEWERLSPNKRDMLSLKVEHDGDFWMEFYDWCRWFSDCSICRQVDTRRFSLQKTWDEARFHGGWRGTSAGGSIHHSDTFLLNPQFAFNIPRDKSELMVGLMQKDVLSQRRGGRTAERGVTRRTVPDLRKNLTVGFHIMKVEENRKYRLHAIQEEAGSITFASRRSVFGHFVLNEGRYVVVPSTFDPAQEREFMLRLYTERPNHAFYVKKDVPTRGLLGYLCCCLFGAPRATVTVYLDETHGLAKQDKTGAHPYCFVRCGSSKASTPIKMNTLDPAFNSRLCFYVDNPYAAQVTVQVWNSRVLGDRFMGQVIVPVPEDGLIVKHSSRLMQKGKA